jgi:hypothetical protein
MALDTRTFVPHAAVAGVFAVITAGAVFWALRRPYGRPQDTFDRCVARYAAGTLSKDDGAERCGQDTLRSAITASGQALYYEIDAIYDRAEERGRARVRDAMVAAYKAGRSAFSSLPYNEQVRIKGASKQAFVYSSGLGALSSDEQALVADASVLLDATKRDALVRALGQKAVNGAAATDAARTRAGAQALAALTLKVERAGNAAFKSLSRDKKDEIEERSYFEYAAKEGFARLDDAGKAAIGTVAVLTDLSARTERIPAVGRGLLDPADQAKLPNKTHKEFAAAHDVFVDTEGRRIIGSRLVASFKQSRPDLEIDRYSGTVIAWSGASGAIRWRSPTPPDAAVLLGSSARFERNGNAWTMDWR